MSNDVLLEALNLTVTHYHVEITLAHGEITLEVDKTNLHALCTTLKNEPTLSFEQLIDISGMDYQTYGCAEWMTEAATHRGFDRGVNHEQSLQSSNWQKPRFAAVYHLLSLKHKYRLRVRSFADTLDSPKTETLILDSVTDLWASANWYEREVFDLYGIQFKGHPDLQRLLTDYGFEGHPFRKDFPLIGKTEVRYDAKAAKVIHEPVSSVTQRTVIPKVIRSSNDPLDSTEPH